MKPLMNLKYTTSDGQEQDWHGTENALKVFLLEECGPDITITRMTEDGQMECRLTKAGDFAIVDENRQEEDGTIRKYRIYLKPRSRCTVTKMDGTQVVNTIIDLDARTNQVKRVEMMEEFLTDTTF